MENLQFGILGCGGIVWKQFLPAIKKAGNATAAAISSRKQEKADEFAAKYDIPLAFGSYEEMLQSDKIQAVYIPLPNSLHKEWALKALDAGKHVLCEKPLAVSAADCLEMDETARQKKLLLMEAFMYRFQPLTEKIIEEVQSGILGGMETIQAVHSFLLTDETNVRLSKELNGGSLMDVGCYCVNAVRTLFNEEPEAVSAVAHFHAHGVDDQINILARFKSGRSAVLSSGLVSQYPSGYTISGKRGYIHTHFGYHLGVSNGLVTRKIDGVESTFRDSTNEYTRMIEHFSDCVLHNKPLRYDAREAAKNMAFIEAALASARNQGEWTKVETI
jgi:predicted dehydrogenase